MSKELGLWTANGEVRYKGYKRQAYIDVASKIEFPACGPTAKGEITHAAILNGGKVQTLVEIQPKIYLSGGVIPIIIINSK